MGMRFLLKLLLAVTIVLSAVNPAAAKPVFGWQVTFMGKPCCPNEGHLCPAKGGEACGQDCAATCGPALTTPPSRPASGQFIPSRRLDRGWLTDQRDGLRIPPPTDPPQKSA